jgi:hypothetical protein
VFGPAVGLAAGLVVGFLFGLAARFVVGPVVGFVVGFLDVSKKVPPARELRWSWTGRFAGGFMLGLVGGLLGGLPERAWGWFGVARCWLALRGRLPWRLMASLDDAHRRGVLRQAGAVYQFRHARLQDR